MNAVLRMLSTLIDGDESLTGSDGDGFSPARGSEPHGALHAQHNGTAGGAGAAQLYRYDDASDDASEERDDDYYDLLEHDRQHAHDYPTFAQLPCGKIVRSFVARQIAAAAEHEAMYGDESDTEESEGDDDDDDDDDESEETAGLARLHDEKCAEARDEPVVVFVCGARGCGKSTLMRALQARLGARVFHRPSHALVPATGHVASAACAEPSLERADAVPPNHDETDDGANTAIVAAAHDRQAAIAAATVRFPDGADRGAAACNLARLAHCLPHQFTLEHHVRQCLMYAELSEVARQRPHAGDATPRYTLVETCAEEHEAVWMPLARAAHSLTPLDEDIIARVHGNVAAGNERHRRAEHRFYVHISGTAATFRARLVGRRRAHAATLRGRTRQGELRHTADGRRQTDTPRHEEKALLPVAAATRRDAAVSIELAEYHEPVPSEAELSKQIGAYDDMFRSRTGQWSGDTRPSIICVRSHAHEEVGGEAYGKLVDCIVSYVRGKHAERVAKRVAKIGKSYEQRRRARQAQRSRSAYGGDDDDGDDDGPVSVLAAFGSVMEIGGGAGARDGSAESESEYDSETDIELIQLRRRYLHAKQASTALDAHRTAAAVAAERTPSAHGAWATLDDATVIEIAHAKSCEASRAAGASTTADMPSASARVFDIEGGGGGANRSESHVSATASGAERLVHGEWCGEQLKTE